MFLTTVYLAQTGTTGEAATKALHLTLAYQFPPSHFSRLESLVDIVDPRAPAAWEVRLYSRDTRIVGNEVMRLLERFQGQIFKGEILKRVLPKQKKRGRKKMYYAI